jgi:hypothetical protein
MFINFCIKDSNFYQIFCFLVNMNLYHEFLKILKTYQNYFFYYQMSDQLCDGIYSNLKNFLNVYF